MPQLVGRVSGSSDTYVAPQARLDNPLESPGAKTVDEIVAADVAADVALAANLPITSHVTNRADTLDAQVKLATKAEEATTAVIEKPQLVAVPTEAATGLQTVIAKEGDTVSSIAQAYGISADTVRWANNLSSDEISPGMKLTILPVSGVLYVVGASDTPRSLAATFKTTAEEIIAFNDIEVKGLKKGRQIIIPGGVKPAVTTSSGTGSVGSSTSLSIGGSFGVQFSGNKYAYGYCTYYAYNKRAAAGRPVGSNWGNATTWAALARASGFSVNNSPRAGDVFQTSGGWGGYGHVGYVERVNSNGSVLVSEMNYAGWNVVSSRTLSASEARGYNFIH